MNWKTGSDGYWPAKAMCAMRRARWMWRGDRKCFQNVPTHWHWRCLPLPPNRHEKKSATKLNNSWCVKCRSPSTATTGRSARFWRLAGRRCGGGGKDMRLTQNTPTPVQGRDFCVVDCFRLRPFGLRPIGRHRLWQIRFFVRL